jgi:hypothetical protein
LSDGRGGSATARRFVVAVIDALGAAGCAGVTAQTLVTLGLGLRGLQERDRAAAGVELLVMIKSCREEGLQEWATQLGVLVAVALGSTGPTLTVGLPPVQNDRTVEAPGPQRVSGLASPRGSGAGLRGPSRKS